MAFIQYSGSTPENRRIFGLPQFYHGQPPFPGQNAHESLIFAAAQPLKQRSILLQRPKYLLNGANLAQFSA
jgi:hypothetical protein